MSGVYDLATKLSETTNFAFNDPIQTIAILENVFDGLEKHLDLNADQVTKLKNYLQLNIDIIYGMGKALKKDRGV